MAHLDLDFPRDIAAGSQALRERRTDIVTLASGFEERNARWSSSRRSWSVGLALRDMADLDAVLDLFEQARGAFHSFRFRDWSDWRSGSPGAPVTPTDQPLGTGDGAAVSFQIVKRYGVALPYTRAVALPHAASVRVAVDGAEVLTGWSVSTTGGRVIFDTAPAAGAVLRCGFTYDVPVRFAGDAMGIDLAYFREDGAGVAAAPDIALVEVRLV